MPQPRLAFEPDARRLLCQGFNVLADLMQVALGPRGRRVAGFPGGFAGAESACPGVVGKRAGSR